MHNGVLARDTKRGDWLMFMPAGAYNLTAASMDFIGLPRPKEFLIDRQGVTIDISPTATLKYQEAFCV